MKYLIAIVLSTAAFCEDVAVFNSGSIRVTLYREDCADGKPGQRAVAIDAASGMSVHACWAHDGDRRVVVLVPNESSLDTIELPDSSFKDSHESRV